MTSGGSDCDVRLLEPQGRGGEAGRVLSSRGSGWELHEDGRLGVKTEKGAYGEVTGGK